MIRMGRPGVYPGFRIFNRHCSSADGRNQSFNPPFGGPDIILRQRAFAPFVQDIAQKLGGLGRPMDAGLPGMQFEPAPSQKRHDPLLPSRENKRIVVKQREVVDIAQIGRLQDFCAKVVERIEIDVRTELTGQIADGQASPPLKRR